MDICADKECPFSGVTIFGRVWRKVPESDARSLVEGAGKRCLEFGGRYRKGMLGVWRKVPEGEARSLEEGAGKRCSECDVDLVFQVPDVRSPAGRLPASEASQRVLLSARV